MRYALTYKYTLVKDLLSNIYHKAVIMAKVVDIRSHIQCPEGTIEYRQ